MDTQTKRHIEFPVRGMDCIECTLHVQRALAAVPGVHQADVFLASEKAVVAYDAAQVGLAQLRAAVVNAGYQAPASAAEEPPAGQAVARRVLGVLGLVIGAVLLVVVAGEWLGLFESLTAWVPWPVGWLLVGIGWWPILRNVIAAAWRGQILAHTLMSLGVVAALAVGEWTTAAVVVFFMRVGDGVEQLTAGQARRAVRDLNALAPTLARVLVGERETMTPIADVRQDDVVVVRPGETIPVDGEVVDGQATVNQATLTGEATPVEAGPGSRVFAATTLLAGSLRVRTLAVGDDSTFGRVVRLVEDAERHRADVQRLADRFSACFLPFVAALALLVLIIRRDPLATAAVLVVACSCSIALATPIAMLASIGAAAKRGLLIKGGKYLELLAKADVLLIDKTGTLTLGRPQLTDVVPLGRFDAAEVLRLAASAERFSEHPLAEAVRRAAVEQGLTVPAPTEFVATPGLGVQATVDGQTVQVGSARILGDSAVPAQATALEAAGKTVLHICVDGEPAGFLAAADTVRAETPAALARLRELGIATVEVLTGDNDRVAAQLAAQLGVAYRANLLPADKLVAVQAYQAAGKTVVMVGDGINDAPALAQAHVGMAMGAGGSALASEAAHVVLLRDDWSLVPEAIAIAQRTLRVVRGNLWWTVVYNMAGLSLAAAGLLPPVLAAVAQSIPDLFILGNSARLLRQGGKGAPGERAV
jgi:Cu+-exporting ATPase